MSIYRLVPDNLGHSSWEASSYQGECVARATSEDAARHLAHHHFWQAAAKGPGGEVPLSPWKNADLVRTEMVEESGHEEDGPPQILVPFGYS